jgi:hypothetical protein
MQIERFCLVIFHFLGNLFCPPAWQAKQRSSASRGGGVIWSIFTLSARDPNPDCKVLGRDYIPHFQSFFCAAAGTQTGFAASGEVGKGEPNVVSITYGVLERPTPQHSKAITKKRKGLDSLLRSQKLSSAG